MVNISGRTKTEVLNSTCLEKALPQAAAAPPLPFCFDSSFSSHLARPASREASESFARHMPA